MAMLIDDAIEFLRVLTGNVKKDGREDKAIYDAGGNTVAVKMFSFYS